MRMQLTHISILLVHMTKLKPDIVRGQWSRRVVEDVTEALGGQLGTGREKMYVAKLTSRLALYLR